MLVYELMDRDTGFEPAPSAWRAEMLAADTNPGFIKKREVEAMTEFHGDFTKEHPVVVSYNLGSLLRLD